MEGQDNPADWTTKPWPARDLGRGSFWQVGPSFLRKEVSDWPIKRTFRTDKLEGELIPKTSNNFLTNSCGSSAVVQYESSMAVQYGGPVRFQCEGPV